MLFRQVGLARKPDLLLERTVFFFRRSARGSPSQKINPPTVAQKFNTGVALLKNQSPVALARIFGRHVLLPVVPSSTTGSWLYCMIKRTKR